MSLTLLHDEIIVLWQGFLSLIYIARQIYTLLKTLFLFHISCLHGRIFGKMKFTPKMPISFLLILQNCQLIMIMWFHYYFHHVIISSLSCQPSRQLILVNSPIPMFAYVLVSLRSVYIVLILCPCYDLPILTHCDPRKFPIFPICCD